MAHGAWTGTLYFLDQSYALSKHAHFCRNLNRVPNSRPGRESLELEIFGMAGVPEGLRPGATGEPGSQII